MFVDGWTNFHNKEYSGQPSLVVGKLKTRIEATIHEVKIFAIIDRLLLFLLNP